ncbi:hypothetical protein AK830_g8617 [Neonectria ditissima]|uniref:Uncharacterized protein n=1 Tax=Neonectria ditissima TaxID=78410 RepID=A0A0P7AK86_9HYPO|nr:hypothetical protein AK830_g8617 [Neonectria ditissima]
MSGNNIYVSNGTCYSAKGEKLGKSFIPCGNNAYGYQTCCGAGDNCLVDNSCFGIYSSGYGSYLTYMAGCTDPDYEDSSCPDKKGIDQPWIALTLCDDTDGEWAACSQKGDPTTLQPGSYCSCTDAASATLAFKDSNKLEAIASLPQSTGETIVFLGGNEPTSASSAQTTETAPSSDSENDSSTEAATSTEDATSTKNASSSENDSTTKSDGASESDSAGESDSVTRTDTESRTLVTISTTSFATASDGVTTATKVVSATISRNVPSENPSNTSTSDSTSSQGSRSSGLAVGAKVGIGIAAGVILLIALAALFFLLRRKRRPSPPEMENGTANGTKLSKDSKRESSDCHPSAIPSGPILSEMDGKPLSEVQGRAADPSNVRSELDGRELSANSAIVADKNKGQARRLSPVAELPGSETFQIPGH